MIDSRSNNIWIFRALLKGHNAASLRVGGLILFGLSILFSSFANLTFKFTPLSAILFSLGGTIPRIIDSLSLSLQMLPILIALLIWGKYLNNELCFRCQLILPRCKSVSVWYVSLLAGMGAFSASLSIIGLIASGIGGLFVQEILYRVGIMNPIFCIPFTEYVGSKMPLESISNILCVFGLFFLRLLILLLVQFEAWLMSAKANVSFITTLLLATISMFFPEIFLLPVGGTMFFGRLNQNGGFVTGLTCAMIYLLLLGYAGWIYCKKTDWMTRFGH